MYRSRDVAKSGSSVNGGAFPVWLSTVDATVSLFATDKELQ